MINSNSPLEHLAAFAICFAAGAATVAAFGAYLRKVRQDSAVQRNN